MATWDDVRDLALELPEVTEDGEHHWTVRGKGFVWARPLRRADREFLGDAAPDGPVLGARVADVGVQQALAQSDPGVYFVTP
ncbi:MAG: MmcQ/YjbR family DNA-binding protein, partial [Kineosporiaceae bacterium]